MNLLVIIILSMLPISELRGAIPLAISYGINPITAFLLAVIANIFIILPIFFFLDYVHKHFMKIKLYEKSFNIYINKNRKKLEKHVGTKWEFLFIILLTAIPLPFTGAYTASILSWFFGLKRKKAFLAISLGVLTAGVLVTLASIGIINFLKF